MYLLTEELAQRLARRAERNAMRARLHLARML